MISWLEKNGHYAVALIDPAGQRNRIGVVKRLNSGCLFRISTIWPQYDILLTWLPLFEKKSALTLP